MKRTILTKMVMLATLVGFTLSAFSQIKTLHLPSNSFINDRVWENNEIGLLWWKCDSMFVGELFTDDKAHTGLTVDDEMLLEKEWTDKQIQLNHRKYQHFYKGIKVEGSEYREHFQDNGMVVLSNGLLAEGLNLSAIPEITESQALSNALGHIGAETYAWEDDSLEYWLQQDSILGSTTYFPKGELVFALGGNRTISDSNYTLAWKFRIFAITPNYDQYLYVNANNGNILDSISPVCTGDFDHIYYGNRYLDTRWYGGLRKKHFLQANDDGRNILTKDDNDFFGSWRLGKLPDDKDGHWQNSRWGATSSHYVVQEAWAMYQHTYGRNGLDDNNGEIRVHGNDASNSNNASYSPSNGCDRLSFGSSNGNLLATLDIGGHEFTHGVDEHSGGLVYINESGALDESFADIFGFMTERFVLGSANWTVGEDANFTIRDMQNPNNFNHPSWYLQPTFWKTGPADLGGVHSNSGVQNKYFQLLSEGGVQLGRTVQGVGIDIAAEVTYYSFTNLTGSAETYPEAREHAIAAARILYGVCSFVENQVCRSWSACNIGPYCAPCAVYYPVCWTNGTMQGDTKVEKEKDPDALDSDLDRTRLNELHQQEGINTRLSSTSLYPNPSNDKVTIYFGELTYGDK
jgi:Zn-dependent metalloprotease